jgi:hypothetical protein
MIPSPVYWFIVPSKRCTPAARIAKKRSMMRCHSSGSSCSASSIEPFTSAKSTVTCLRSPSSAEREVRIFRRGGSACRHAHRGAGPTPRARRTARRTSPARGSRGHTRDSSRDGLEAPGELLGAPDPAGHADRLRTAVGRPSASHREALVQKRRPEHPLLRVIWQEALELDEAGREHDVRGAVSLSRRRHRAEEMAKRAFSSAISGGGGGARGRD